MKDLNQKKLLPKGNRLIIYTDDYSKIAIAKFSFDFILESVHPLKMKNGPKRDDKVFLYDNKLYVFTPRNNITEITFDEQYKQKDVKFNPVHSSIFDFAITRDKFMTQNDEQDIFLFMGDDRILIESPSFNPKDPKAKEIFTKVKLEKFLYSGFSNFIVREKSHSHIDDSFYYLKTSSDSVLRLDQIPSVDRKIRKEISFVENDNLIYYIYNDSRLGKYVDVFSKGSQLGTNEMVKRQNDEVVGVSLGYNTDFTQNKIIISTVVDNKTVLNKVYSVYLSSGLYCVPGRERGKETVQVEAKGITFDVTINLGAKNTFSMKENGPDSKTKKTSYFVIIFALFSIIIVVVGVAYVCMRYDKMRSIHTTQNIIQGGENKLDIENQSNDSQSKEEY